MIYMQRDRTWAFLMQNMKKKKNCQRCLCYVTIVLLWLYVPTVFISPWKKNTTCKYYMLYVLWNILCFLSVTSCCFIVCISFSELSVHISVHSTWPSDVSMSNLPGAKRQGGLWVPTHPPGPRTVLWVSAGQPAGGQHLPQRRRLCDHWGPQEEQRQPGQSHSVPPHLGPAGWWEALHLHLQGLPGHQLEGEQHGCASQWVESTINSHLVPPNSSRNNI